MLGKHFTIRTLTGAKPTRHYTVCNVMAPSVYRELVRLLKQKREILNYSEVHSASDSSLLVAATDSQFGQLVKHLTEEDQPSMMFVIKNYNRGLSQKFYHDSNTEFEVKGPMGKSLNVLPHGQHVAFAAGTGILPFMDLVA